MTKPSKTGWLLHGESHRDGAGRQRCLDELATTLEDMGAYADQLHHFKASGWGLAIRPAAVNYHDYQLFNDIAVSSFQIIASTFKSNVRRYGENVMEPTISQWLAAVSCVNLELRA
jgi:hypothetical protein